MASPEDQMRDVLVNFCTAKWDNTKTGGAAPSYIANESLSPFKPVKTDENVRLTFQLETEHETKTSGNSVTFLRSGEMKFSVKIEGDTSKIVLFRDELVRVFLLEDFITYLNAIEPAITHYYKAVWFEQYGAEEPEHNGVRFSKGVSIYFLMKYYEVRS